MGHLVYLIGLLTFVGVTRAEAHGERPLVVTLSFPAHGEGGLWLLTDTQGAFTRPKDNFRWLCEDAVEPSTIFRGIFLDRGHSSRLLLATSAGLFLTDDGGCNFQRWSGALGSHNLLGLWTVGEGLVTASASPGGGNGLWYSSDQGDSWTRLTDLGESQARSAAASSELLYIATDSQLLSVSSQGEVVAQRWPAQPARASRLLFVHPEDSNIVFASLEALPESQILRSVDGGVNWSRVFAVADLGLGMVSDQQGTELFLYGPLGRGWRSMDGGQSWSDAELLPPGLIAMSRVPQGQRLYASSDVFGSGPWSLGYSDDLGRTWSVELGHFAEAVERWDCAPDDRALRCCRGLCPGQPPGAICGPPTQQADNCIESHRNSPPYPAGVDGQNDAIDESQSLNPAFAGDPNSTHDLFHGGTQQDLARDAGPPKSGCSLMTPMSCWFMWPLFVIGLLRIVWRQTFRPGGQH